MFKPIYSISKYTEVPYYQMDKLLSFIEQKEIKFDMDTTDSQGKSIKENRTLSLEPSETSGLFLWSRNWNNYFQHQKDIEDKYRVIYNHSSSLLPKIISNDTIHTDVDNEMIHILESAEIFKSQMVWHFNPILFTNITEEDYWIDIFTKVIESLAYSENQNLLRRVVIGLYHPTNYSEPRMKSLTDKGLFFQPKSHLDAAKFAGALGKIAIKYNIEVQACSNPYLVVGPNMKIASCVDTEYMNKHCIGNSDWPSLKTYPDKFMEFRENPNCQCTQHIDLGFLFDTCSGDCRFCLERIKQDD